MDLDVEITINYRKDDPEMVGDHHGGEIHVNGHKVADFQDHYHESRTFRDGVIEGVAFMADYLGGMLPVSVDLNVKVIRLTDSEY